MELGYLLINGHWGALGTYLHATWDILALAPTSSQNMPLVEVLKVINIHCALGFDRGAFMEGAMLIRCGHSFGKRQHYDTL